MLCLKSKFVSTAGRGLLAGGLLADRALYRAHWVVSTLSAAFRVCTDWNQPVDSGSMADWPGISADPY